MELAGEVEAVGAAVTEFAVGDRVFGVKGFGAHAEYVCVRESGSVAHMPAGMTFEEAAAVCDGALHRTGVPEDGRLQQGRRILVYGAIRIDRHGGGAAGRRLRRRRHRRVQHEEPRARALARRRAG